MPYLLKPDLFNNMKSPLDAQKLAKSDVKNAAGQQKVSYVATKSVKIGTAIAPLFVVTDNPKAWEALLKERKATTPMSGECQVIKDGNSTQLAIKTVTGGSKDVVVAIAQQALKDPSIEPIDYAALLARRSHQQALKEGKIDRPFQPDAKALQQMTKVTYETGEYHKFASEFAAMAKKYNMTNYDQVPVKIWASLINGLAGSGYFDHAIPKAKDGTSFILGMKGTDGKVAREKVLGTAMTGLNKFRGHAETYLDKVVAEVSKNGAKTWSFWSGVGAKETAIKKNPGGVVLEGSVGSWFDKVWDFKPLTGVENLALWTTLSELYAESAAKYYHLFEFRGYVGPGATREQSVFNMIEQPTFIQILNAKATVPAPKIDWFVVECAKNGERWESTDKDPIKFGTRDQAVAKVKELYGG